MTMQETTTETKKVKVANHELIDASKNVVDDEESAAGIRYTLLANGETFDWLSTEATPQELAMLAIFGAKTLATNETSQARNNPKGEASADEQIAAVRDRFALLRQTPPVWIDRTREGVGAKIDKDALAEAICRVMVKQGKKTQAEVDGGFKATTRQRLEDDKGYLTKARQVRDVSDEYAAIVGKPTVSVDDLLA